MLELEWDEAKAKANLAKHGVTFETARHVFKDMFALDEEERSALYGESRRITTGLARGEMITVVYTERGEAIRIVSARKATKREASDYAKARN